MSHPPLTSTTLPLTYLASSLIKKTTTSATSSGNPNLALATMPSIFLTSSSPASTDTLVGVSIYPGATTFVLIPLGPNSNAMHFEKPTTAYFVAQ
ncbi:hypothetical protein H4I95_09690 [Botrytis cinerea]